ncbi:nucleotide sugar dehydrogenase [Nitrosopumilus cobalaminigenes]|uniref:UDP-N-acetyl-D-mannosamine dehydrogenase n=1 Tax=Nitrosopumilus cobalaminigenes TaxID=1470066 RepID=A0A7D5LZN9_9ARCH|nr:nucleotide sugar dehydrogenase [Nitrosopumilus cobalaminigenes]QLH02195.1 nucleotide sugar dehydrogenase [Nitrosopumilus cobalaminigenes]
MNKKIFDRNIDDVKKSIKSAEISVCVIGIGRIGLPTALSFAKSGLLTTGLDINTSLVEKINSGDFPLKDEPKYDIIFDEVLKNKTFHATTQANEIIPKSDVILLSLPTPMNENNIPDYSALKSVANQLHSLMTPGTLVVVESTIEPGFLENELIPIIDGNDERLESGINYGIGVCPETANPGEIITDFEKLPRLVGGINKKSADIITEIYHHVFPVQLIPMPNCKTANAVKLTTNVFRDINIAFINELSILFEKLGIDTNTVLEAAKTKYNFQVHYPGAGVGGPCLPINSYQFLNSGKQFDDDLLTIIKASRKRNESMPHYVIDMINETLSQNGKLLKNCSLLIMGVSYKPNVKDIQLTPAEIIINKLKDQGAILKIYDPYFKSSTVFGIETENNLEDALHKVDAVILLTAHKEFLKIEPSFLKSTMKSPIVIDTRGVFDVSAAKEAGLIIRSLGRKF